MEPDVTGSGCLCCEQTLCWLSTAWLVWSCAACQSHITAYLLTYVPSPPLQPCIQAIVVREYFSGANALGPYLTARFIMDFPLGYGPFILITLIYWMTGKTSNTDRPYLSSQGYHGHHHRHHPTPTIRTTPYTTARVPQLPRLTP